MKYRLTVLVICLSFVLAACSSLSGDITPPPDYQSPTPAPTGAPATQTLQPTLTSEPTTVTTATEPAGESGEVTPDDTGSATPSAPLVTITGVATTFSDSPLPEDLEATLFVYDLNTSDVAQTLTADVLSDGTYQFTEVPAGSTLVYWVSVKYSDVVYDSDPVYYSETQSDYDLSISLYDTTDDLSALQVSEIRVGFNLSSEDVIQVTELFILTNPASQAVTITTDGTTIPFIEVPEDATDVQYRLADGSSPLLSATDGVALLPGIDKQYGFLAIFSMPYGRNLKFTQSFPLSVSSMTLFVPQGMRLRSKQLTDSGTQDIDEETYLVYENEGLASGDSLSLTLSGKPGASTGFSLDRQAILVIGISAVGILLIALGVYLFLRERALSKAEAEEDAEDISGEDQDGIMDALIALDDQYKAGEISQEAYEKRRAELKEQLEKSIQ